jgi:hypothetical protein
LTTLLDEDLRQTLRVPYALRRIPAQQIASVLPIPTAPQSGDIALATVLSIGKNTRLELTNGRNCTMYPGDRIAVVFGNRYATRQFEGYARSEGPLCDLMSMGGLCGIVESKCTSVAEPSKLRLEGALGDTDGHPLRLGDYALPPLAMHSSPRVLVVCGTAMDSGKTYTASSVILGLRRRGERVAGIKLTGTAAGRDTWNLADAGAIPALDFLDGGYPSTFGCSCDELLALHQLLLSHAATHADWVVIEVADGLLQVETAALLQSSAFISTVHAWLFATGDPLAATGGIDLLRQWAIAPLAISGIISMSPLAMREATQATGVRCLTADELRAGAVLDLLLGEADSRSLPLASACREAVTQTR